MAERSKSGGMFRSLRFRNARLYFLGLLLSNIGTWVQFTATSFLLYDLRGNATVLGINTALQFLPMLVLGAWAGALADRIDRLTLTRVSQVLQAVQAFALAALVFSGNVSVEAVYVLSAFLGIVTAIENPSRRGLITELIPVEDLTNGMSLNTATMTGSRIFGPAIAAALIGVVGIGWLFMLNGVSYAAMLIGLALLRRSEMFPVTHREAGGTPVRDSLRFIRNNERLAVLFAVFTLVSTFAFNYSVSLPKLADEQWGRPEAFGWVLGVTSIGSLIGALLTARLAFTTYRWVAVNVLVLAVSNLGMAWSPNVVVAFVWAIPLGLGGAAMMAGITSLTQLESPPDMRGRMLALTAVAFLGSTPIGGPVTGFVADFISVQWSLAYGGVLALVAGSWMLWWISRDPSRKVSPTRAPSSKTDL
jgi:MFS family permease